MGMGMGIEMGKEPGPWSRILSFQLTMKSLVFVYKRKVVKRGIVLIDTLGSNAYQHTTRQMFAN